MTERRSAQTDEIPAEEPNTPESLIEADDLIEEVSIDGMCGVY
ncbi:mycofactocin precursor MftA [Streptomyces shenzhenensis]